jgi:tetratricopeptide (TPR) repeat protein
MSSRARRLAAAAVLVLALGQNALAGLLPNDQAASRILVMPFENVGRDNRIFWLGEAAAVLLADDLNALGASAITREQRQQALELLQIPQAAALTDATVIRIGQVVGASKVVVGTLQVDGDDLLVHARTIGLDAGRVQSRVDERGPIPDLYATFERIARQIAPPSPRSSAEVLAGHPPILAFEHYVKGLLAETPATAISYLNQALQIHPPFVRPRLALWKVFAEQGDHESALHLIVPVASDTPFGHRARFLKGLSQLNLGRLDDAFATLDALAAIQPGPDVFNNLGVVQLRRGAAEEAADYFNEAIEAEAFDPEYYFNLGYAYWRAGAARAAVYALREAVRRDPADGDAHFVLGAALAALGNAAEAARERDLARRLSPVYDPPPSAVPDGLERVKSEPSLPRGSRPEAELAAADQRDHTALAGSHLERARHLFAQELDTDALSELRRVLFLSPYDAEAHLLVGRIHRRNGRLADALSALKISVWSQDTAEGRLALAETYLEARDAPSAREEASRALALEPGSTGARAVLDRAADVERSNASASEAAPQLGAEGSSR